MGKLIYTAITSLDGYVEDQNGRFDWARPDETLHRVLNELERPLGTYLYGRRMYETMVHWETAGSGVGDPSVSSEYAEIWRAAKKVVYSRTLRTVVSAKTRTEPIFDPAAILRLKESSATDIAVGGAELAGHAIRLGLVDECHLFLCPVLVGSGKRSLPDGVRVNLELLGEQRLPNGVVHLHLSVGG